MEAIWFLIVFVLLTIGTVMDQCSFDGCSNYVNSKNDAHEALQAFFSSDSRMAQGLVEELRKDGLTDDRLAVLKQGCRICYVRPGERRLNEDPDRWYVSTPIAPSEAKKSVVLKINCAKSVLLDERYYGG